MKHHTSNNNIKKYVYIIGCCIVGIIITMFYLKNFKTNQFCLKCNIVIISIDPLRADNLPCFGYIYNTTPNICRFANRSNIFTNAYAQSSWTLPSIMSMISSQYPYEHGMMIPYQSVLRPETITLPQALKQAGYHTVFMGDTQNSHLPLDKGLGRGFETISDYKHNGEEMEQFLTQQKQKSQKPLFMFIHNFDMSASWTGITNPPTLHFDTTFFPPKIYDPKVFTTTSWKDAVYYLEQKLNLSADYTRILSLLKKSTSAQQAYIYFKQLSSTDQQEIQSFSIFEHIDMTNPTHTRFLRNLYDERLLQVDQALGPILETLTSPPWRDNTIVIVVANHGDELGEHGRMSHGTNLFASTTHIPFIIRIPNTPPRRITELVASIDIYPTILDIIGVGIPKSAHGESLSPLISNKAMRLNRGHIISQLGPFPWISMIRTSSWSYYKDETDNPPQMLFDLTKDPSEQLNVIDQHGEVAKKLQEILAKVNQTNNIIMPMKIEKQQR